MYELIIKRLRDKQKAHMPCGYELCGEAADAIEQLQNERDKAYARLCEWCDVCPVDKRDVETCEIAMIGKEYEPRQIHSPRQRTSQAVPW